MYIYIYTYINIYIYMYIYTYIYIYICVYMLQCSVMVARAGTYLQIIPLPYPRIQEHHTSETHLQCFFQAKEKLF